MNLVKAELLKVWTTSTWWVLGLITLPLWAASLGINWLSANVTTSAGADPDAGLSSTQVDQLHTLAQSVNVAAGLYTSGQFLGVLMVMLLGAILVTNEFFHQTATTTFLGSPRRESVILAKLAASVILGLGFWAVTTLLNLVFAPLILHALDFGPLLGNLAVWRAIGLNALAYGIWAILGVGAGVLIRSQLGAAITLPLVYVGGFILSGIVFALLITKFGDGIGHLQVLVPTEASQLMITGTDLPGKPPRWVGALVLLGYAAVTGLIGTVLTKTRDIS